MNILDFERWSGVVKEGFTAGIVDSHNREGKTSGSFPVSKTLYT